MVESCGATAKNLRMIGSNYPDCSIGWCQLECLQLILVRKGDWYCPDCVKKFSGRFTTWFKKLA